MSFKVEFDLKKPLRKLWDLINKFNIGHLLLLSFALHMFAMASTPDSLIFDEAHYLPAARATLNMQSANLEHMPLVKIMTALSMRIFGDWWFAWRFPIVLTAIGCLFVFYLLAKRFMPEKYALLSTIFLSFDVMFFIHGSICILDMPAIFFGVLGVELYFAKHYKLSAASLGVSFLMKELGLFFMFTVVIYHFAAKFRFEKRWKLKSITQKTLVSILSASLVFLLVGGGGLWVYDIAYRPTTNPVEIHNVHVNVLQDPNGTALTTSTWTEISTAWSYITNPIDHLKWAWNYFTALVPAVVTPDADYRPPWGWIMPFGNIFNSPKYLVVAVTSGQVTTITLNWVAQINPLIAYAFLPLFGLVLVDFIRRKSRPFDFLYVIWGIVTYLPWLIVGLFFQRMTFNYYFLYTIPVICLGIGWSYSRLAPRITNRYVRYGLIFIHLAAVILFFVWFFPLQIFR
jgi:dolichyl-phosphate-mannose--protein O-mannosyl transferase